jgi:hypothetical protein
MKVNHLKDQFLAHIQSLARLDIPDVMVLQYLNIPLDWALEKIAACSPDPLWIYFALNYHMCHWPESGLPVHNILLEMLQSSDDNKALVAICLVAESCTSEIPSTLLIQCFFRAVHLVKLFDENWIDDYLNILYNIVKLIVASPEASARVASDVADAIPYLFDLALNRGTGDYRVIARVVSRLMGCQQLQLPVADLLADQFLQLFHQDVSSAVGYASKFVLKHDTRHAEFNRILMNAVREIYESDGLTPELCDVLLYFAQNGVWDGIEELCVRALNEEDPVKGSGQFVSLVVGLAQRVPCATLLDKLLEVDSSQLPIVLSCMYLSGQKPDKAQDALKWLQKCRWGKANPNSLSDRLFLFFLCSVVHDTIESLGTPLWQLAYEGARHMVDGFIGEVKTGEDTECVMIGLHSTLKHSKLLCMKFSWIFSKSSELVTQLVELFPTN